jgi:hypothetical protein
LPSFLRNRKNLKSIFFATELQKKKRLKNERRKKRGKERIFNAIKREKRKTTFSFSIVPFGRESLLPGAGILTRFPFAPEKKILF